MEGADCDCRRADNMMDSVVKGIIPTVVETMAALKYSILDGGTIGESDRRGYWFGECL